ncbi:MFS transporter [Nocardioides psychrotolerans]|uniref:Drug resistance transporter, EmrB/QacA subfamily n=1 Tax=Nocardioides psychrotolerans TaxID=1005945 RepID=A0A1I3GL99_9ACTN|nr:MFS transporter [Nocardioides psychrotolerans]GEP39334.1 MFS transporter [Nocardioides psychrotolerans]SFI24011.1 drug resistance transporter, EmrB/QacA subfamily [Nocardioides psychrotolerans]
MSDAGASGVRLGTPTGRAVIAAAALGSGMTMLDATVVNVALRSIGEDLDASLAELQWITNGYLLSLASLILLGGSLGDRFGRRRVFVVGTVWFAGASLLCGLAPTPEVLILARVLQGVGGAMLTPGSLAMIQGAFAHEDRARAIGAWSGLGGIATALGPFVGGVLIDSASWRWIFLVNAPLALVTVVVAQRAVPETRDPHASAHLDVTGALLATAALGGTTYALIQWGGPLAPYAGGLALLAGAAFILVERREREPMLELSVFADRTFSAANAMTLLVYAALGAILFFLTLQLQTVGGYGALAAGTATLPMTACLLLLAARGGELGARLGPRLPLSLGPVVMAVGTLLLLRIGGDVVYWRDVLPGITVFGLGLALLVAPLTATVLAAASDEHAGIASGVSNAVSRAG